ncbi:hypothetical protein [Herbaspirillum sp. NPDC101396]|uniref:hypothetical protein n=1 Tax=Herbaspirillum sp. NPDC101396 TaxID=3364005 RepID=UPI00383A306A
MNNSDREKSLVDAFRAMPAVDQNMLLRFAIAHANNTKRPAPTLRLVQTTKPSGASTPNGSHTKRTLSRV